MTHRRLLTSRRARTLAVAPLALAVAAVLAVDARLAARVPEPVELLFVYSSEKEKWLEDVTAAFHRTDPAVDGRPIRVKLRSLGAGLMFDELIDGESEAHYAHLVSQATDAWLDLGNARALARGQPELTRGPHRHLVRSAVVIAMWENMARALGWPGKRIGWQDLHQLAQAPNAWAERGYPQFDPFHFADTHPESSDSGLLAVLSEVYAATGKRENVTEADVKGKAAGDFLAVLQHSAVHYGRSADVFADTTFAKDGPVRLSAAVLYESQVVQSRIDPAVRAKLAGKLVAIYPREGTFWSDHPVAVVKRDHVTRLHREAAEKYVEFLLEDAQQKKALTYGFRPGLSAKIPVALAPPLDAANGVDPDKPGRADELKAPGVEVMTACMELWKAKKRKAQVVLVLDASNAMSYDGNEVLAREGAAGFIKALGPGDWLAILASHHRRLEWLERGRSVGGDSDRADLARKVTVSAGGPRQLYDAIAEAHRRLKERESPELASAIVVLTDGRPDRASRLGLPALLAQVKVTAKNPNGIRVFTVAFSRTEETAKLFEKDATHLLEIAQESKARAFFCYPANLRQQVRDLATAF
jgi:Ca-activated chloride channel family protein